MSNVCRGWPAGSRRKYVTPPAKNSGQVGFQANRRLLAIQRLGHDPIAAARVFHSVTDPVTVADTRVARLRLGDPRAMALLSLLAVFRLSVRGFTNRELRRHFAPLLGLPPGAMTAAKAT